MRARKDIYVTGYKTPGSCIYGKTGKQGQAEYADPQTLTQANEAMAEMERHGSRKCTYVLYKLVPVREVICKELPEVRK